MSEVSIPEEAPQGPKDSPAIEFEVLGVRPLPYAAAPTLAWTLEANDPTNRDIVTIALSAQIMLEPAKRTYSDQERERLSDLFGAPERWGATTHPTIWGRVDLLVPSFRGSSTFELRLPCTYDMEVFAPRYLRGLSEGEAPVAMHMSGTVMFRTEDGRMWLEQISWETSVSYKMPVAVWDELISKSYPGGGWIVLHEETIDKLMAARAKLAMPTLDDTILDLIDKGVPEDG